MKFKCLLLLAMVFIHGCGAPYQVALPIDLGKTGSKSRHLITIQASGFYTVALAFSRDYQVSDKRAEQLFNDVVLSGSAHSAKIGLSLARKDEKVFAGDYSLTESGGVVPVAIGDDTISSNIRLVETVKLDPGEYSLEYENLLLDEELGALKSYILIFRDEPKP